MRRLYRYSAHARTDVLGLGKKFAPEVSVGKQCRRVLCDAPKVIKQMRVDGIL